MKKYRLPVVLSAIVTLAIVVVSVSVVWAQSAAVPPPGMIGWWPGDGNADDLAGSNDGVLVGATLDSGFVADGTGQAFYFDDIQDRVEIPDAPSLDITGAFSVAAWVNVSDLSCGTDTRRVMQKIDNVTATSWTGWNLDIFCDGLGEGTVRFEIWDNSGQNWFNVNAGAIPVQEGVWTHIAATWDGSRNVNVYVDGDLSLHTQFPINYMPPSAVGTNSEPLRIGRWFEAGLIDEPQLYDRAITAEQVTTLYEAGSAGTLRSGCPYESDNAVDAITDLVSTVESFNLQQGISNSLDAKLASALNALDDVNANNNASAVNKLSAFLNEVEAQRGDRITDAQADDLATCGTWAKWLAEGE